MSNVRRFDQYIKSWYLSPLCSGNVHSIIDGNIWDLLLGVLLWESWNLNSGLRPWEWLGDIRLKGKD